MKELLPYTMLVEHDYVPRPPYYARVHTRSDLEQIRQCVPVYLQGMSGVILLIRDFIGVGYKWICVHANLDEMYANRHRDLYFLYAVLSRRLALPRTLDELLRLHHNYPVKPHGGPTFVDAASTCLPLGHAGLMYTRTGHMGTSTDLRALCRLVTCHGQVTRVPPDVPGVGRHLVIQMDRETSRWPPHVCVRHPDTLSAQHGETHWDTVTLFHLPGADDVQLRAFPDDRQLSGRIHTIWTHVTQCLPHRSHTIICSDEHLSEARMMTYLHALRVQYNGCVLVPPRFVIPVHTVIRTTETLLLHGVLCS